MQGEERCFSVHRPFALALDKHPCIQLANEVVVQAPTPVVTTGRPQARYSPIFADVTILFIIWSARRNRPKSAAESHA